MVKVFVGNIPSDCARVDIIGLFEKYGKVKDCDIIRNFAFIHFDSTDDAQDAIDALNKTKFMGNEITVEESTSRPRNTHKLYIGNISSTASRRELQKLFEEHGEVTSCDIIKDFAFVHMAKERDAEKAIKEVGGVTFAGRRITVEFARNDRRQNRYGPDDRAYREYYDRWYDYYYGGGGRGGGMSGYRGGGGGGGYHNDYRRPYNYGGSSNYRQRSPVRRRRPSRSRSRSRSYSRSPSRSRSRSPKNDRKSPRKDRKSSSRSRSKSHTPDRRSGSSKSK